MNTSVELTRIASNLTHIAWRLYYKLSTVRRRPRAREFDRDKRDKLIYMHVIEPAKLEWAALIVFVAKDHEAPRFFVDYRIINEDIVRGSYPLPKMDLCIESLRDALVFSTLDATSGH